MNNNDFTFIRLASNPISKDEEIRLSKMFSRLSSQAAKNTKRDRCYYCGKICSSFCNSHSIPTFALERIAENGKIFSFLDNSLNPSKESRGIKNTGTFQIICNDCDSKVFQNYENPNGYNSLPSDDMLSQIALKNYLQLIWKRTNENELYRILKTQYNSSIADEKLFWGKIDLDYYSKEYIYTKRALEKNDNYYYICIFRKLDYVIPYAAQAAITLVGDLEDNLINNLYETDVDSKTSCIHIMALPLKETSIVLAFIKNGEKRYRKFYKQLQKLSSDDQLSTINYILFSNSENIFVNPTIAKTLVNDDVFQDVCKITADYTTDISNYNVSPVKQAIKEFSLSRRKLIPNLLAEKFSLK